MSLYDFGIFERAGVDPAPSAVVYGIESGKMAFSAAPDLEEWMMENRSIEGSPGVLVAGSRDEALEALREAGYEDGGAGRDILRYAALASMDEGDPGLPYKIEEVYSDFGYPKDMEPCVYYMPAPDGDSSPEGLGRRFNCFLTAEKNRLGL